MEVALLVAQLEALVEALGLSEELLVLEESPGLEEPVVLVVWAALVESVVSAVKWGAAWVALVGASVAPVQELVDLMVRVVLGFEVLAASEAWAAEDSEQQDSAVDSERKADSERLDSLALLRVKSRSTERRRRYMGIEAVLRCFFGRVHAQVIDVAIANFTIPLTFIRDQLPPLKLLNLRALSSW
ncbi:hypothetical protein PR002_g6403 [Phytophthora rubi]|uniref:Uncharacterized protein n=1 Tax=Phytophthora rubi TaxID=129364 RepID=A0A6A3N248_9STRA|nr:hypothetical protein PR002_g6403 [Phytophthora rubi]